MNQFKKDFITDIDWLEGYDIARDEAVNFLLFAIKHYRNVTDEELKQWETLK